MKIDIEERMLHFKQPAGTSRGIYTERRIWLVKVIDGERVGIGECAPLPNLSCDDLPDYSEELRVKSEEFAAAIPSAGDSSIFTFHSSVNRPEMRLFDAQLRLADVQEKGLNAALMPRLGVFAQGYYGYPGYNMFEDMMSHRWRLNGMIGARLTWNIGALYTRKNDKVKIQLQREVTESNREVFLFNNRLEQIQQQEEITRYRKLIADDEEIIALRSAVRKAAESKLTHGIIDVNDLVREINQENAARLQQSMHEIELLKQIYDNKFTTNN
jgi:hypothetical protein